jgi:cytochrome c553
MAGETVMAFHPNGRRTGDCRDACTQLSRRALSFARLAVCCVPLLPGVLFAAVGEASGKTPDANRGKQLAVACAACHGADGNTANPKLYPNLAGQSAAYIVLQLKNFKSGERPNVVMKAFADALPEADMEDLGAYYSGRKAKAQAPGDVALQSKGQKVFSAGSAGGAPACASCHGDQGQGNATFPRIASQPATYTLEQLHVYRDAPSFTNPLATQMKQVAIKLSEDEMKAVSAYLAILQ